MPKTTPVPCTREEIDALIESAMENDFSICYLKLQRKTGRRIGEYYNVKVKRCGF